VIDLSTVVASLLALVFGVSTFLLKHSMTTRDKRLEQNEVEIRRLDKMLLEIRIKMAEEYVRDDHLDRKLDEIKTLIAELKKEMRGEG
jgi:hypothetical protein